MSIKYTHEMITMIYEEQYFLCSCSKGETHVGQCNML